MKRELTFEWKRGSANDNMIRAFKAAGIPWRYNGLFILTAALNGSDYVPIEYYKISGDTYGITQKPPRADKYFGIPAEELWQEKPDSDGYFREELKALDRTYEPAQPMAGDLKRALDVADYWRCHGYETVDIVASVQHYGSYYIICQDFNPDYDAC